MQGKCLALVLARLSANDHITKYHPARYSTKKYIRSLDGSVAAVNKNCNVNTTQAVHNTLLDFILNSNVIMTNIVGSQNA